MQAETALLALEGGLRLAIGFSAMSTLTACARGVPRINKPHVYTGPGCLVGDVHPQLGEDPGMPFVAIFVPNRCPLSNPREVFQSECLARYDGFVDQGLTDRVVHIFLKTLLTSRELLEATFRRAGSDPLQLLTTLVVTA